MTTKAIEARISEAVMRHAVSEADGNAALDELKTLRERVDYLEDAVKLGGEVRRSARIALGLPPLDEDDLALKERAESAERALEVAEHREAMAKIDGAAAAERELFSARADARIAQDEVSQLRAKVTRQRRELRRLNLAQHHYNAGKERAIYWVGRVATECFRDVAVKRLGDDVHRLVEDAKRAAKAGEKPAEDRVVRVGDRWSNSFRRCDLDVVEIRSFRPSQWAQEDHWAVGRDGSTMAVDSNGEPRFESWTLVSRKAER